MASSPPVLPARTSSSIVTCSAIVRSLAIYGVLKLLVEFKLGQKRHGLPADVMGQFGPCIRINRKRLCDALVDERNGALGALSDKPQKDRRKLRDFCVTGYQPLTHQVRPRAIGLPPGKACR